MTERELIAEREREGAALSLPEKYERLVVALGGNALGNTPEEQREAVTRVAKTVADLIESGAEVVLTHGNGPQVGMIHLAFEVASGKGEKIPPMPLAESTAMSEGYIGYHLQNALMAEFEARRMNRVAVSLITQVEVEENDPAFRDPKKPIGAFYSAEEAARFREEHPGAVLKEDAGRGYRRMVASPKPRHITELAAIRQLLAAGVTVIACGGGGVPVIRGADGKLHGTDAVIDKDLSAERLAEELGADALFILTAVDRVKLHFGTPEERAVEEMTTDEARRYIAEGHFAPGSMLPKVEAAIAFAESGKERRAVIASLEKAPEALSGASGTIIRQ